MGFGQFVDRDRELDEIRVLINALRGKAVIQFPVREFVGVGGIGKSIFLQAICRECENIGVNYVFVDLAKLPNENEALLSWEILFQISDKFCSITDAATNEKWLVLKNQISSCISEIIKSQVPSSPPLEIIDQFLNLVSNFWGVFLFDSVEVISPRLLEFLGQEIVFPSSDTGQIVINLASRSRIDWGSPKYKIWRRTKSTTLNPFSQEDTLEQLSGTSFQNLGKEIHAVTSGHPASNDLVVEILRHIETIEKQKISRELFGDYEARLVSAIVDKVIRQIVVVPDSLFKAFCVLSVLRRFDVDLPADLLARIDPSINWRDPFPVMDLILSMRKETDYLVTLDTEKNGYTIDHYVRKVLSLYMRFRSPEEYLALNKEAFEYYDKRLLKSPTDIYLIIEKLYHLADIVRMTQPQKYDLGIAIALKNQLEKDLLNNLGNPYESSRWEIGKPIVTDAEERRRIFDRLRTALEQDQELIERIGDTEGFLIQALKEVQKELLDTGKAVLDIVKHQPSYQQTLIDEQEIEEYSVSFHVSQRNVEITVPLEIPLRRKKQLLNEVRLVSSIDDLIDIGKTIRNHFLPTVIQDRLKGHDGSLIISVNDTEIPWEIMHDDEDFISLQLPLGKRLRTAEIAKVNRRREEGDVRALLVGVTETSVAGLDPLPHIEDEIINLTSSLRNVDGLSFSPAQDVILGQDADSYQFLKRLGSGRYDIIHFAGHTYFDEKNRTGGLVLSDMVVSLDDLKRSVGGRPLVFLNACQSAADKLVEIHQGYVGSYTLGIASAFILGGALACVGSIWKVMDSKGSKFATRFYKEVLSGVMIGEALRRARVQTRLEDPTDKTWASYVLFGDPTVRTIH